MSTARHMIALLGSHVDGDDGEFLSVAVQAAATWYWVVTQLYRLARDDDGLARDEGASTDRISLQPWHSPAIVVAKLDFVDAWSPILDHRADLAQDEPLVRQIFH